MSDLESQALEMMSGNEKESEQAAIKRLASLSPIDYDRARKTEAKKLGISVSTLDKAVNVAKEALKKVARDGQARRNQMKKRSLQDVNEHFESDFNTA